MRIIVLALLIALSVAGCKKSSSSELLISAESMDFSCSTGEFATSRATESVEISGLDIKLFAYASASEGIYIDDAALSQEGTTWKLSVGSEESAEWPESGTVDFFAYSPATDLSATGNASGGGFTISGFEVEEAVVDQEDLMVAYAAGYSSGTVPLTFEHQLSCFSFGIIQSSGDDNTQYSVTEISLSGISSKANLTIGNDGTGEWSGHSGTATYTISTSEEDDGLIYSSADDYATTSSSLKIINTENGYMKLIPQTVPSGAKFSATVVSSTDATPSSTIEFDLGGSVWEANEHYIFTLTFGAKDISFSAITVSEWEQQSEASLDESTGVVNMHLYDDLETLESVLTIFSYFNIRNISVLGSYFDGCIGDMDYTVDISGSQQTFTSNSPYLEILTSDLEILDLSGITYEDSYSELTKTPEMAFSPGFIYSTADGTFTVHSTSPLHTVLLPDDLTEINRFAFALSSLEQASYANITKVGEYAFVKCLSLRNVVLEAATEIGDYAFFRCTSLQSVTLRSDVTLGTGVFDEVDTESCDLTLSGTEGVNGSEWGGYTWKSITTN